LDDEKNQRKLGGLDPFIGEIIMFAGNFGLSATMVSCFPFHKTLPYFQFLVLLMEEMAEPRLHCRICVEGFRSMQGVAQGFLTETWAQRQAKKQ
jgi:hypothetical protein